MREAQQLVDGYLDGELTPKEQGRFVEWLAADAEHIRQFVRETSLHRQIRETMLARPYHAVGLSEIASAERKAWPSPVRWLARQWGQLFDLPWSPVPRWAVAAVIVILCVLVLPGFLRTQGVPELSSVTGAQIQIVRGEQSLVAEIGLRLQPNDVIRTTGEGKAVISYGREATRIELKPNSELRFLTWKNGKRFDLRAGKLEATVARQRSWRPMVLVTAQAEARVLGTKFTLEASRNATQLEVTEGKVKLKSKIDQTVVDVSAGNYTIATTNRELTALPLTGGVLREYWTNLVGGNWVYLITYTNYPNRPDGWAYLTNLASLEMPSNWANNYGARIRGYLHPPETGDYTIWIAANAHASLWVSPDADAENKVLIATSYGPESRDWQNDAAQRSASFQLTAGRKYYFEVLHKAGVSHDHLAVAWQRPGRAREIIPGEFLSPFKADAKEKQR